MLIPSLSNVVFVDILSGIKEALDAQGYLMLIGVTGYSPEAEETCCAPICGTRPTA